MISGLLIFRHAFLFLALIFAHRAFCALDILARARAETRRFLPRPTLFFPPKISMAELMLFNCFCSFDASPFNADRMSICPPAEESTTGYRASMNSNKNRLPLFVP